MKAYTDIEQSHKLAKILPLDSADMYWSRCTITDFGDGTLKVSYAVEPCNVSQTKHTKEDFPCWSLAALMELLPEIITVIDKEDEEDYTDYILCTIKEDGQWTIYYKEKAHSALTTEWLMDETSENLLDAAYNVIVELHSRELL